MHSVLTLRGFQYGHLFKLLDPGLSLRGFGSIVAEFVDERLQVGTLSHLVFIFALGCLAALFFGSVEGVEVGAFIIVKSFRVLMDYVGCYFIQKGSVVGDDKEGAGIGLEITGEEGDGGDVQHVGRFCKVSASILRSFAEWSTVEEEQVWLAEERSGQCQSHPPTPREGFGGIVLPFF